MRIRLTSCVHLVWLDSKVGRSKRGRSLKRRTSRRRELRTVYVFCEGEKSEPDYLGGIKRLEVVRGQVSLKIEVDPQSAAPKNIVERAIKKISDPEIDECWCIFDVEAPRSHPNIEKVVELALRKGVKVAVSNPCFELWLVLHRQDYSAYVNTADIVKTSKDLEKRSGKSIDPSFYMDHIANAVERADKLRAMHQKNGTTFPRDNPSSGMSDFIRAVGALDGT